MRERRRRNAMPADARARVSADLRRALDARPEVSSACLHGSFTAGEPFRDVDVAVWLEPATLGESGGWQYASTLAQDLERATGVPVDVQVLNDAPLGFRYHALRGEPLLVRGWDFFDDLRARTWDDYFDFRPFARRYLGEVLGPDRLRDLAGHLGNAVRQLRELGQMPRESFLADPRAVNSAKYLLIVAAEAALDICNHVAARRGGRSPEDYADCIAILAELGAIDEGLRQGLVRMARFRNLLVHLYWRVVDAEVHRVIREDLGDFDEYLASLGRYLGADLR